MKVIIADHNQYVIELSRIMTPLLNGMRAPLAFDIDAVVSPANTAGIMNGGLMQLQRTLRKYTRVQSKDEHKRKAHPDGRGPKHQTVDPKVKWLIVAKRRIVLMGCQAMKRYHNSCIKSVPAQAAGATSLSMTGLELGGWAKDKRGYFNNVMALKMP